MVYDFPRCMHNSNFLMYQWKSSLKWFKTVTFFTIFLKKNKTKWQWCLICNVKPVINVARNEIPFLHNHRNGVDVRWLRPKLSQASAAVKKTNLRNCRGLQPDLIMHDRILAGKPKTSSSRYHIVEDAWSVWNSSILLWKNSGSIFHSFCYHHLMILHVITLAPVYFVWGVEFSKYLVKEIQMSKLWGKDRSSKN